jgi:dTDP-4-dehydrorhamnose 3,5-epimerase
LVSEFSDGGTFLQKIDTSLPGVWELRPKVFGDARGFFMETYHRTKFGELGITDSFVQDNHSTSRKDTLRGLHYQLHHPQAKLCRVIEGEALDVAVDLRPGSPHFGKCSDFYDLKDERGVLWSDPTLKISWGISNPLVSEKDAKLPTLAEIPRESLPQYRGK